MIYYTNEMKQRWPFPLADEWLKSYPALFDQDDRRLLIRQAGYHFFEWLAAIHLFHRDGWLSLVEKYVYASHPRKVAIVRSLMSQDDWVFLAGFRRNQGVQPPDLLLYQPNRSAFRFAEVKGPSDRPRAHQLKAFERLKNRLGTTVEVITVTHCEVLDNHGMQRLRRACGPPRR